MVVSSNLGAAFEVDDANGPAVTDYLAKDIRAYLRIVLDDKKAGVLAEQWPILSNIKELRFQILILMPSHLSTIRVKGWKVTL